MNRKTLTLLIVMGAASAAACGSSDGNIVNLPDKPPATTGKDGPPVATDPEPPVDYPPSLYERGIEGRVVLQLYVNATGAVIPDSTKISESSGYPAFDSSAVAGSARMHFSPAMRNGQPIAATTLQPILFRHPESSATP